MSQEALGPGRSKMGAGSVRRDLRHGLWLVFAVGCTAALIGAVLENLDRIRGISPERVVTIYRTHECHCAFRWAAVLEDEGYIVRLWEYETLEHVRTSLGTPTQLQGCHVASYLNYFLEGHVSPTAIRRLSHERPAALGIVSASRKATRNEHDSEARSTGDRVLIVDRVGDSHVWIRATSG